MAVARTDLKESIGEYLSKEDRFATRMRASMRKSKASVAAKEQMDQNAMFVDGATVSMGKCKYFHFLSFSKPNR